MKVDASPMPIGDYCAAFNRGDIVVNKTYQRSDQVWPSQARSFLIETIFLGYPIPKFILNRKTDPKNKTIVKEIVDGQQRSKAIIDFFNNKLRLSRSLKEKGIAGKIYDDLHDDLKTTFLSYSLDIDLFGGSDFNEVVEAFRRLNSFTFPVNAAEKRHARYQRGIKWSIFYFCRRFEAYFRASNTLSEKSIVRMSDSVLIAEIWDAIERGITTTKAADLERLYKKHNVDPFDDANTIALLTDGIETLQSWTDLYDGALSKSYMTYALVLAIIHVKHCLNSLNGAFSLSKSRKIDQKLALRNLTTLATAFESKDVAGPYGSFVMASEEKTNVEAQRVQRFQWFCKALTQEI